MLVYMICRVSIHKNSKLNEYFHAWFNSPPSFKCLPSFIVFSYNQNNNNNNNNKPKFVYTFTMVWGNQLKDWYRSAMIKRGPGVNKLKGHSHIRKARRTSPRLSDGGRGEATFASPRLCMYGVGAAQRQIKVIKTVQSLVEINIY